MSIDDFTTSHELIVKLWDGFESGFERHRVIRTGQRPPIAPEIRAAVLERDRRRCQWCHSRHDLQLDHILPWSAGGPDEVWNLRVLCGTCNKIRSNFVADAELIELRPNARTREYLIRHRPIEPEEDDA